MSKFDLGLGALRAGLMAAVSFVAVNSAHATLVNSIPSGTVVTPPNNGSIPASFFSSTGPFQIGTGVGRDIVWTSNNPSSVGGYSAGYGLCDNGSWTGSPPYFGTNSPNNSETMTFTFNDGDVSSVGGFMSWGRGCFGAANFTIEARNASNSLLESYTLNFATSGAQNSGEFWAIERATADIRSFIVYGGFVVLRNFTFLPGGCPVGAGDDTCLIDSTTNQATAIDADGHATGDTLQVGGPTDFNFNVAGIGTTYTNFEVFQKVDASNVTLTGTAGVAANWQVLAGTLTASGGNAIFDTSNVDVSSGATFALSNNETIGSLTGAAGSFVTLGANTLTTGGDNSSTTFAGLISGVGGGLTKTGSGTMTLTGANTYTGITSVLAGTLAASVTPSQSGIGTSAANIASGATLRLDRSGGGNLFIGNAVTGTGTLNLNFAPGSGNNTHLTGIAGFNGTVTLTTTGATNDKLRVNNGLLNAALVINPNTTLYAQANTTFAGGIAVSGTGNSEGFGAIRLDFGATVGGNISLLGDTTVGGLNGGGSLSGNISTGVAGLSTLTAGQANGNLTFSGAISDGTGALGLTKIGTGSLTLSGANSYTGATNVNAGVVRITNGAGLGSTVGGTTVAAGAALEMQGGVSVGAESLTLNGDGIATGGALRNVAGNNTFAGPITLGSASRINSDANSLGITGAVNNGGFLLTVGGAGNVTFSGGAIISGAGGLTKDGTGVATLFMANTYMGVTTVNDGVLQITGGSAIANTGAVVVNAPGQLQVFASESIGSLAGGGSVLISGGSTLTTGLDNTNTTFSGVISEQLGSAVLIKQGTGNFTLSGANTYTGATSVNAGTLTLAGGSAIANTGAVTVAGGATLALSASEQIGSLAGAGAVALGANTLTTGDASNTSFTGTTSGAGGITKVGAGKFSTGALANTGTNTINAGEMNVNGNVAGSVVVNSGGTLSGTNTIAGSLTLNSGGTLKTGNSPGTTNVAGNYIGGGSMSVEVQFNNAGAPVNGATHDFLNVTGNVTNVTTISIVPFAPSTAPVATVGNGIELVRVGGTTASGAFALAGPVVQGGYEYVLKYLADYSGTSDGYFLQSGVRQEIAAISGAAMGSSALGAACSSAESRIDAAKNSRRHGWATGNFGSLETDADSGLVSDGDSTCVNTGMTFASGLPGVNMGFSLSLGSYDGTLSLIGGASTLEGSRFGAEAIVSYAEDMFFVTAAAGFASQDFEFKGSLLQSTGGASGLTANVAAGVRVPVAGVAELTLAGVLDYNDAVCRDACFGFASYSEGDAIMTGTIKAMANASFGPFSPYAGLSYSTVMSDDAASVLGAPVASFTGDGLVAGTLGAGYRLSDRASLFVEGKYADSMDVGATSQSVSAGIRAAW